MRAATIIGAMLIAAAGAHGASAKTYRGGGGVPPLDVKGSCMDAQKFSTGMDKNNAFKGCMQDENLAKDQLTKRWSSFKPKDRSDCVEQARTPSPSYVEVLTCLEMDSDAMANAPKVDGRSVPQIGGPVAPGLTTGATPK